jgi:Sulfatase-modifying factor enzyme 1
MKPSFVLFVSAVRATFEEGRAAIRTYSDKRALYHVAAVLGALLTGSSLLAGDVPVSNPAAAEKARGIFEKASKEQPWQNSLGMKFVPINGTQALFSIWDTRLEDFQAFVDSTGYEATEGMWSLGNDGWKQRGASWKDPGFKQGSTHPVVGVSWDDAKAFCEWLTKRERSSGGLPEGLEYRLPTDEEWSVAVGLDSEPGSTPQEKSSKIKLYVWGQTWPPPAGSGNYCGVESKIGAEPAKWIVIDGYNDGYPRTSPVGSFTANRNGLYDMGGNVWQWCEDWYNSENTHRVLRGAAWDSRNPIFILASARDYITPDYRGSFIGFRCVLAKESYDEATGTEPRPQ